MRPVTLLAFIVLTALAPAAATGPGEPAAVTCEPPRSPGNLVVLPCTVSAHVETGWQATVRGYAGTLGPVIVDAQGPYGERVEIVCPFAVEVALCGPPVPVGVAYAGAWSFTARPLATDLYGPAWLELRVNAW